MQMPRVHIRNGQCPECAKISRVRKIRRTNLERYGVENSMQRDEVKEKVKSTNLLKYGTEYALASDIVKAKKEATMIERYGGRGAMCSEEVRTKAMATNLERYGVMHPAQSPDIREKMMLTSMERYGAAHPRSSDAVRRKVMNTLLDNGSFNVSEPEEVLYGILCRLYGSDDVRRQYSDGRYPYACDFYIISRDMYIELNGYWSHGGKWFDSCSVDDALLLSKWVLRLPSAPQYRKSIKTWTGYDVMKRLFARKNKLNYVVFWDTKLRDVALWEAMG